MSAAIAFDRVLIAGVGLIGGSIALALRRAGFVGPILGFDVAGSVHAVRASGAVDSVEARLPARGDVSPGDLVVIATPIGTVLELLRGAARDYPAGAVVTDVGSTKREVCAAAEGLAAGFVGGHPVAGAEHTGIAHARTDMFDGAAYFLCGDGPAIERVEGVVRAIGSLPVRIAPEAHDRSVARSSHVPQLVASALAASLPGDDVAGPGLADMTRLAGSGWSIWRDILMTNRDEMEAPLSAVIRELEAARDALARGDEAGLERLFRRANDFAARRPSSGAPASPPA